VHAAVQLAWLSSTPRLLLSSCLRLGSRSTCRFVHAVETFLLREVCLSETCFSEATPQFRWSPKVTRLTFTCAGCIRMRVSAGPSLLPPQVAGLASCSLAVLLYLIKVFRALPKPTLLSGTLCTAFPVGCPSQQVCMQHTVALTRVYDTRQRVRWANAPSSKRQLYLSLQQSFCKPPPDRNPLDAPRMRLQCPRTSTGSPRTARAHRATSHPRSSSLSVAPHARQILTN
jgi:hypothetical protein